MLNQPLFPIHSFSLFQHNISSSPQQASCTLFIRQRLIESPDPQNSSSQIPKSQPKYQNLHITLSIHGQFITQKDPTTLQIISAFKCDFQIKFWLIRSTPLVPNSMGKLQGIAFQFPSSFGPKTISLFIIEDDQLQQSRKKLQKFSSLLQRKFVVQKNFHQKYKAIKRIGKGITACVYSSLCLADKSQVAIKSFKKQIYFASDNGNGKKGFLKEFKILTLLDSKYLSRLLGVYQSDKSIYIVQQLLDRTLYNYLQKFGFPETSLCRQILFQLLIGLRYLHAKNIMHRDLKLENIMIRGPDKNNIEPVIVDFGLAEFIDQQQYIYVRCGTPGYVAPQIINLRRNEQVGRRYDRACDVFSLGVIFHILLLGKTVFQGQDLKLVVEKNKECQIDYEFKTYPFVSPEIKDLLRGMLRQQPTERYTVKQIMRHCFFIGQRKLFRKQIKDLIQIQRQYQGDENDSQLEQLEQFQDENKGSESETLMNDQNRN